MESALSVPQLRTFVTVAECHSFSRAATALNVTQPALSQRIRLLERRLDAHLFDRGGRPLRLTARGEEILVHARRILAAHDEALARLDTGIAHRRLTIGVTDHFSYTTLPYLRTRLEARFPDLATRFRIDGSTALAAAVVDGSIDLALVMNHDGQQPGIEVANLPLAWFAPLGWEHGAEREPLPLISLSGSCAIRDRAEALLARSGVLYERIGKANNVQEIVSMVRGGMGLSLLPVIGDVESGLQLLADDLPPAGTIPVNLIRSTTLPAEVGTEALASAVAFFSEPEP